MSGPLGGIFFDSHCTVDGLTNFRPQLKTARSRHISSHTYLLTYVM